MSATASDVAKWMLEELQRTKHVYQDEAVFEIERKFGDAFVYDNENGNRAISRAVLKEFRKLTESTVVWERGDRCWRLREKYDEKGRGQS